MCISNLGNRRPMPSGVASLPQNNVMNNNMAALLASRNMLNGQFDFTGVSQLPTAAPKMEQEAPKKSHIVVQHNYHDHASDNRADYQEEHPARGGVTTPFPIKLHEMLDAVIREGKEDIVSWQPHGRCFLVHKPKEFVELLPIHFKLSKIASFQRQLNLYGFQRLTRGRDRGGYYHELFLRDKVFLSHSIQRIKVKGTGVRARSNPDQEPDFWSMPWVGSAPQHKAVPPMAASSNCDFNSLPMPTAALDEDFDIDIFDKPFHCVDPFQPNGGAGAWTVGAQQETLSSDVDGFFDDFDFPSNLGNEIEDDSVFGNLLEQMLA
eukprot:Nitzschia sp. Nitz4//scaffold9_size221794//158959//159921//NITZ4_001368-RA/size221794-processed-gene-0.339-mRNA-1//-1//CDS//3329561067//1601//frame0